MRILAALLVLAASPAVLGAQGIPLRWDASVGVGDGTTRGAVAAVRPIRVYGDRLVAGLGLRLTGYAGEPTSFTNRGTTQGALAANLPVDPAVLALNVMVEGSLRLAGPLSAGMNIDLAGLAAGPARTAGAASLEVARGSLLQGGNADRGSLNSEFYVAFALTPRAQLRVGASHYVIGYTGTDGGASSRYQRFETVPFAAVRLTR